MSGYFRTSGDAGKHGLCQWRDWLQAAVAMLPIEPTLVFLTFATSHNREFRDGAIKLEYIANFGRPSSTHLSHR